MRAPELFTATVDRITDSGLTTIKNASSGFSYVTDGALRTPELPPEDTQAPYGVSEVRPDGTSIVVCPDRPLPRAGSRPFDADVRRNTSCWSRTNGQLGLDWGGLVRGHVGVTVKRTFPFLLAAVDPEQEAKLVGLDRAVNRGKYLPTVRLNTTPGRQPTVPVIMVDRPGVSDSDRITVRRLPEADARRLSRGITADALDQLLQTSSGPTVATQTVSSATAYANLLRDGVGELDGIGIDTFYTTGPTSWRSQQDGVLAVLPVKRDDAVWASEQRSTGYAQAPSSARDTWFRPLQPHVAFASPDSMSAMAPGVRVIGAFTPDHLTVSRATLNKVPLETYDIPTLLGADARSRTALHGKGLGPTDSPAGYLQSPPMMLTNLASVPYFLDSHVWSDVHGAAAPISAIRVRVAGVRGADAVSRERVRLVADVISRTTGLDVDVTVGSSPSQQTILLPAGENGRPELLLHESWVKKGVATAILTAIDRKSLMLFVLVLLVSASFVANAATAAVRARRRELAMLSCLGWGRGALARMVMLELGAVGLVAGVLGAGLAFAVGAVTGTPVSALRAGSAVPASVLLALLAAVVPAVRASGTHPAGAIRPAVSSPRRARTIRSVRALALSAIRRVPGRTALAALSLAVGVCALTLMLAVSWVFKGSVVGSLLGDAVAVQVRSIDVVAVAITLALSCAAVADVVFVGLRERSRELAALQAVGWSDGAVIRLVAWESLAVALCGAITGAGLGLAGTALLAGQVPFELVLTAVASAGCGVVLTMVAAAFPARQLLHLPTARLLAGD